ncbi:MAG TPA: hypothetical protein VGE67_01380 [Haloferula sp.]
MTEIDELRSLFGELRDIMVSEGAQSKGGRYIEGLCCRLWDDSIVEDLKGIKRDYGSLCASRPFSDFYIWRDESEAMVEANRRLDQIRGRLGWLCRDES